MTTTLALTHGDLAMAERRKANERPARKPHPAGESFDASAAQKQTVELYPKVMSKLAE